MFWAEVIAAKIHQHKLAWLHRSFFKATHHAIGRLPSDWPLIRTTDMRCSMA